MPIALGGLVEVLGRRPRSVSERRLRRAPAWCAAFAAVTAVFFPLHDLVLPATWRTPEHVRAARQLLDRIPDGARVAATNRLAPQLTRRTTVSLACTGGPPRNEAPPALPPVRPDWVAADLANPLPCTTEQLKQTVAAYQAAGYRTVAQRGDVLLLHHPSPLRRE
jgi:hypothetical protein